jgi:hypothetical protein
MRSTLTRFSMTMQSKNGGSTGTLPWLAANMER